jgi:Zn-dependent M28 family amino/carboxypeptidase
MLRPLVFVWCLLCSVAASSEIPTKDTSAWWGHIKVLASDECQGRLTGSPGYQRAADYVAGEFQRFGLVPAGDHGYLQRVDFEVQTVVPEQSRVTLTTAAAKHALRIGDDLILSPGAMQRPKVDAPLVFAGYGLHLPEAGYDDFSGLRIKGAIVVYLTGGPSTLTGPQRAHAYAEALPRYLEKSGAVGMIAITAPKNREVPWAREKAASVQPGMLLSDVALRKYHGPMFAARFNETVADQLFAGSGHPFAQLTDLADAHQPLPHFPLPGTLAAKVVTQRTVVSANNVVAELPGSDATLTQEAIVLSAHLDHLGTGVPDGGNGIFHGAMDDASGVASMLEVARAMHEAGQRPRRSVLFVAVTGEEKGLLGSRFFASHPTRHAGHLVADINMDMFLPLFPLRHLVGYGADESSLGEDVRAIGSTTGVKLVADRQPDHLIFVRSDQYNFVRRGVPSLMLTFAPEPGTPEEDTVRGWYTTRYHAQADDLSQPIDLSAADAYDAFLLQLITRVADAATAPVWHKDSFFARFGKEPLP